MTRGGRASSIAIAVAAFAVDRGHAAMEVAGRQVAGTVSGADQLRQILRLACSVSSGLDLETVLGHVTTALTALRPDGACAIRLIDHEAGGYRLAATGGISPKGRVDVVPFGEGLTHVVAETRQPLLVADNRADPRAPKDHWSSGQGLTVYYGIPIVAGDEVLGVINLNFPPTAPLTEHEHATVEILADQAAVAIRNARLFAESEARRRAAESLADVSRSVARTLDPDAIVQQIADAACQRLQARCTYVFRLDPVADELVTVASSGQPAEGRGQGAVFAAGSGMSGYAVRTREPAATSDLLDDPRIFVPPSARRSFARATDRAALAVPLIVQDRVVGALTIRGLTGRVFSAEERALAQAFADQAALAFENARLYAEGARRRFASEELARIVWTLTESLDAGTVADRIVESVLPLLGVQSSILRRLAPDGSLVAIAVEGRAREHFERGHVIPPGMGVAGRVVAERRPVTREVSDETSVVLNDDIRRRMRVAGMQVVLAVPLIVQDDILGVLAVGDLAGRRFSADDVAILRAFADHAAVALQNARLYQDVRAARDFLQVIAENSADGIVTTDARGRITSFSRGAEEIFGGEASEMLGERIARYYRGGVAEGHAIMQRLRAEARIRDYETEVRRRDGQWVTTSSSISLLRDADGAVTGTLGVFRDITERKRAEQRQAAQFALTRVLAESATLAEATARLLEAICQTGGWDLGEFWTVDPKAAVLRWEGAWHAPSLDASAFTALSSTMTFRLGEGLPGRVWASGEAAWNHDDLTDVRFARAAVAAQPGLHAAFGFPIRGAAGVTAVLLCFGQAARARDDALVALMSDISSRVGSFLDRKRADDALRQSEEQVRQLQKLEAVGQLAGGIAHDFNNVLTVIRGRSELLLRRLSPDDRLRHDIELIHKTAGRATGLTRQLLAFSRKQILAPKVLDLNALVSGMTPMLERLIGEPITLAFRPGAAIGYVKADPGQLEQVLMNLVVNARDAMPGGGRITLETAYVELGEPSIGEQPDVPRGAYVMLAVSDTGTGMDAATCRQIFEPFFTTKPPGEGTGLGLSTVYGIVKQSDGGISVRSEPGTGTTFTVYLPRVEATEADPGDVVSIPPARGTETILVVEDEPEVRVLVREILSRYDYTVFEAGDAAEAVTIADRHPGPIHLLLADVVMPQMGGRELAEHLAPLRPEMSVLYMSGYAQTAIVSHGGLAAGTAFIQKPFAPDALAEKVRRVLDASARP